MAALAARSFVYTAAAPAPYWISCGSGHTPTDQVTVSRRLPRSSSSSVELLRPLAGALPSPRSRWRPKARRSAWQDGVYAGGVAAVLYHPGRAVAAGAPLGWLKAATYCVFAALLAVVFRQEAGTQLRRAARGIAVRESEPSARRFRLRVVLKVACELLGCVVVLLKTAPLCGAAVAIAGHLIFLLASPEFINEDGNVVPVPPPLRMVLLFADGTLMGLLVAAISTASPRVRAVTTSLFTILSSLVVLEKLPRMFQRGGTALQKPPQDA
eukprot:TRINITY_DN58460_c0_g1_i1.p1 TRINITY_DN58460_c0_g1~~TRINITY_DN58460_c0_g1_i1.p1  ORF type:complete len:269 (+),score=44.88 TRINITY_DN58460_c0_g1_i1:60-866(+)